MRANIDQLVEDEMHEVVDLLVAAQQGTDQQRFEKFSDARVKIREVVVVLMAERQKLYKRLQIARLAAQVRELIRAETHAYVTTKSLPDRPQRERDSLTLSRSKISGT
jgi:hypothetical protein